MPSLVTLRQGNVEPRDVMIAAIVEFERVVKCPSGCLPPHWKERLQFQVSRFSYYVLLRADLLYEQKFQGIPVEIIDGVPDKEIRLALVVAVNVDQVR